MKKLIATFGLAAVTFIGWEQPAECHKGHCHGETIKVCGGGWKRYKETRTYVGPEGGAKTSTKACAEAIEEWDEKLLVEAHSKCPNLHKCSTCPSKCTGCKNESSFGKIHDEDSLKKKAKKDSDGTFKCTLKGQVAFRCSCGPCIVKGYKKKK